MNILFCFLHHKYSRYRRSSRRKQCQKQTESTTQTAQLSAAKTWQLYEEYTVHLLAFDMSELTICSMSVPCSNSRGGSNFLKYDVIKTSFPLMLTTSVLNSRCGNFLRSQSVYRSERANNTWFISVSNYMNTNNKHINE